MAKSTEMTSVKEEEKSKVSESQVMQDREAQKRELMRELMGEKNIIEVFFKKSIVADSERFAQMLNERPKVIAVWALDDGMKAGYVEEVKINGAVAQVPRGVPVYVPDIAAKMFKGYQEGEKNSGNDIPNQAGTMGIRADRDEATKNALGL